MKNYLNDKDKESINAYGRSQGWTKGQTVNFLQHRNNKAYVKIQKARAKKLQEEQAEKIKLEVEKNAIDVDTKKRGVVEDEVVFTNQHGIEFKHNEFENKDGEWYYKKNGENRSRFVWGVF